MFIEEEFEDHLINVLEAAKTETPALEVKKIARIDDVDITLENFSQYAKVQPAVLVGVMDDTVENVTGSTGDGNVLAYEVRVFLLVQSRAEKGGLQAAARPILRRLKDKLRGLRYTAANGAQDNSGRLFYAGTQIITAEAGVALYLQTYTLQTLDINDTRRSL